MSAQELMTGFPPAPDQQVTLENWRRPPFNSWAFHHVRQILPTANIRRGTDAAAPLPHNPRQFDGLSFRGPRGRDWTVDQMLTTSMTDGFVVLKRGQIAAECYANGQTAADPHIVFSVSKSITGTLAGILVENGQLDPDAPVTRYIPEAATSAYGDCTVRHVLDMTVSIDFVEDYLNVDGAFARYRDATGWNPVYDPARLNDLRSFLLTLPRGQHPHGDRFYYVSPNSDLLGWVLERA
ncbi:MAG: serine hydrolase, partial [Dongiaceae bacterium]